jgi:hypothetical protein
MKNSHFFILLTGLVLTVTAIAECLNKPVEKVKAPKVDTIRVNYSHSEIKANA